MPKGIYERNKKRGRGRPPKAAAKRKSFTKKYVVPLRATKKAVAKKAQTRTSAKSVVMDKFDLFEAKFDRLENKLDKLLKATNVETFLEVQKASFLDQFRTVHIRSEGNVTSKEFLNSFSKTVSLLGVTEEDLDKMVEDVTEEPEVPTVEDEAPEQTTLDLL